jgi:hypothetical protein
MLLEDILKLEGATSVQSNTDGITFRVKRSDSDEVDRLVKEWEDITKLEMERNDYSKMYIRDVNNYVAVYEKTGQMKAKGAYEVTDQHHKNQSMLVVQKAVQANLAKDVPIEEFIKNHDVNHDFMLRTKIPKSFSLVSEDDEGVQKKEQNISRYYVSTHPEARSLYKLMPPLKGKEEIRKNSVEAGRKCIVCNNILDFSKEIDYDYYIDEAKKLVDIFKEN